MEGVIEMLAELRPLREVVPLTLEQADVDADAHRERNAESVRLNVFETEPDDVALGDRCDERESCGESVGVKETLAEDESDTLADMLPEREPDRLPLGLPV